MSEPTVIEVLIPGATGATGPAGATGATGPAGPTGPTGPAGSGSGSSHLIDITQQGITLDPTGVSDNAAAWLEWRGMIKSLGNMSPPKTFTITIGSPSVINCVDHGFRRDEDFVTETTGAFPTGHVAGTVYHVSSLNFTKDSFQYSALPLWARSVAQQTLAATSGSQSGTHTLRAKGKEWMEVVIPPGVYKVNAAKPIMDGGAGRLKINCYGAVFPDTFNSGVNNPLGSDPNEELTLSALLNFASQGSVTVTLKTLADVSKFWVGQWVCIMGLDMQNQWHYEGSYPPNNHYFEYQKIAGINTGTGVITLSGELKNSYDDTWPQFVFDSPTGVSGGGPATIMGMHERWDMVIAWHGLTLSDPNYQSYPLARESHFIDGNFLIGIVPTVSKRTIHTRCIFGTGSQGFGNGNIELDKLAQFVSYEECIMDILLCQSSSTELLSVNKCVIGRFRGTTKNTIVRDSTMEYFSFGPVGFGYSENTVVSGCRIDEFARSERFPDQGGASAIIGLPQTWTFSEGKISQPLATTRGNQIFVPGGNYYFNDYAGVHENLGKPFKAVRVYADGSDFCVDTTLDAFPVGDMTQSTATISIASPGVVTWNSHSLADNTPLVFITTGELPTGITKGTRYYVRGTNKTANTFEISTSSGGGAVNTSDSQSGTHTVIANALHMQVHQGAKVTMYGNTGCAGILDQNGLYNEPVYTKASRTFFGSLGTIEGYPIHPRVWGNLVELRVNVRRPFTGTGAFALHITANTADDDCAVTLDGLDIEVDLRTAGLRVITPDAATTTVALGADVDTDVPFSDWLTGQVTTVYSVGGGFNTFEKFPEVDFSIRTHQGITHYDLAQGTVRVHPITLADTGVNYDGT